MDLNVSDFENKMKDTFLTEPIILSAEKICREATPGPWSVSRQIRDGYGFIYLVMGNYSAHFDTTTIETLNKHGKDAEFCAMARTVLPMALLKIRLLENRISRLVYELDGYRHQIS